MRYGTQSKMPLSSPHGAEVRYHATVTAGEKSRVCPSSKNPCDLSSNSVCSLAESSHSAYRKRRPPPLPDELHSTRCPKPDVSSWKRSRSTRYSTHPHAHGKQVWIAKSPG